MKRTIRNAASVLVLGLSAVLLVILIGCGRHDTSAQNAEVTNAIYPLGVDLATLEGNVWTYQSSSYQGKAYGVQVKSIQNGFASFQDAESKDEYVGVHTFGHAQIGYNADGALVGKTGIEEQVIIPNSETTQSFVMNGGLFDGQTVSVSYSQGVQTVLIDGLRIELQRGLGITKIVNNQVTGAPQYVLESTTPDPPVHFGE